MDPIRKIEVKSTSPVFCADFSDDPKLLYIGNAEGKLYT